MPISYSDRKRLAARAPSLLLRLSTLFLWAPLAAQIDPNDRWAVAAYVRALQLASSASIADAPEAAEKLR